MMQEPLISILIPVYNAQPFLAECLETVLCQTYRNLEIICLNDGSTDESRAILDRYSKQDARVRVLEQSCRGTACARNRLLAQAHGEYFSFVDADDKIDKEFVSRLYQTAIQHKSDVTRACYYLQPLQQSTLIPCERVYKGFLRAEPSGKPASRIQAALDDTQVWMKLIKTSLVKKHHLSFLNGELAEDLSFEILLYLHASKITFLKEHLYFYRVGNARSASSDKQAWAAGTLANLCFVCEELKKRGFTDKAGWGKLCWLLLHALRRMRKFPVGPKEQKLCQKTISVVQQILPLCSGRIRWQVRLFLWGCRHVKAAQIPYVAWGFRWV